MEATTTRLSAVQMDDRWRVQIDWPIGKSNYFGDFRSEKEAAEWILQHHWLTLSAVNAESLRRYKRGPFLRG